MLLIIPARGGSKGIPQKNIKQLCGKPLIAYSIEAAISAGCFTDIVVSTDDEQIAIEAVRYGASVPFMRPPHLATDTALAIDAYLYTVDKLSEERGTPIESFAVTLATTPLKTAQQLRDAVSIFCEKTPASLISVVETDVPPSWLMHINEKGVLKSAGIQDGTTLKNRQDYAPCYVPNGAVYIFKTELLRRERAYYFPDTIGYVMRKEDSVDIDTPFDFKLAEFLMSQRLGQNETAQI